MVVRWLPSKHAPTGRAFNACRVQPTLIDAAGISPHEDVMDRIGVVGNRRPIPGLVVVEATL